MTPDELKAARQRLGYSAAGFARLVRISDGRSVRRWEAGAQSIPGPVTALVDVLLALPAALKILEPVAPERKPRPPRPAL